MRSRFSVFLGAAALLAVLPLGRAHAVEWPRFNLPALVKQVSLCKVMHAFLKAPCAGKILGERILPFLAPIQVSGLRASQTLIDLDGNDLKAKVAGWVNEGLDWLGFPDSFRIPKKIGYDVSLAFTLSNLQFAIPRGNEYQPDLGANIAVRVQVLSQGPFYGKSFDARGSVRGKLYLTVAPYGRECDERKYDWTMAVVNLQITKLDVDRIPDFITGSDLFLKLVNWGLNKAYHDYPQFRSRGFGICVAGRCPAGQIALPGARTGGGGGTGGGPVVKIGGASAENRYLAITLGNDGMPREIRLKDASVLCQVIDSVMQSGCTDAFANTMANAILPLTVPIPPHLVGSPLSATVESFRLAMTQRNEVYLHAAASLRKQGEKEALAAAYSMKLEIRPQCDAQTFLLLVRPTFTGIQLSALPRWLVDGIARAAVNAQLKPLDFCFPNFPIPKVGKSVNACLLTETLLQERCTGPLVNAVLESLFPLTLRPEQASFLPPELKRLLQGMRVTVEGAGVEIQPGNEHEPRASVKIAVSRDGEAQTLRTAGKAVIGIATKCGAQENAVRIQPAILSLEVSAIPDWLLRTTVLTLANQALSAWHGLCVYGPCRSQSKINLQPLFPASSGAATPAAARACDFDAFTGGK